MEKSSQKKMEGQRSESIRLGELLKKTREELHIELDEVAATTKIQRHYLEAIENEEWSKLPSQVFVKGFLRSYAGFLGLNKETIIDHYLRTSSVEKFEPKPLTKRRLQSEKPYLVIILPVLALAFIVALTYMSKKNISIIEMAVQYLGAQSSVEKKENRGEKEDREKRETIIEQDTTHQEEREKEMLPVDDEEGGDDASKIALPSKSVDDAVILEDRTIPIERDEEKAPVPRFILTANVKSLTWVAIGIDDKPTREYLFQPGETLRWTANKGFDILIGNAGGIEFFFNGKEIGQLGAQGEVVRLKLPKG